MAEGKDRSDNPVAVQSLSLLDTNEEELALALLSLNKRAPDTQIDAGIANPDGPLPLGEVVPARITVGTGIGLRIPSGIRGVELVEGGPMTSPGDGKAEKPMKTSEDRREEYDVIGDVELRVSGASGRRYHTTVDEGKGLGARPKEERTVEAMTLPRKEEEIRTRRPLSSPSSTRMRQEEELDGVIIGTRSGVRKLREFPVRKKTCPVGLGLALREERVVAGWQKQQGDKAGFAGYVSSDEESLREEAVLPVGEQPVWGSVFRDQQGSLWMVPTRVVPARVDPDRVVATRVDPDRVVPARVDPDRVVATRVDPDRVVPARVDPDRVVATRVDPDRVVPARVDPDRVVAARVDPGRVVPARVDPDRVVPISMRGRPFLIGPGKEGEE